MTTRANKDRVLVTETTRLQLHRLTADDAAFILELLNEPAWLRFIGNKGVATLDDARGYIARGPAASYESFGFGLYRVTLRDDGTSVGICGLVRRDTLPDADIGFAFLERHHGNGYAREAAQATVGLARDRFHLNRLLAIATPDNHVSLRLLEALGFRSEGLVRLTADSAELALMALDLHPTRDASIDPPKAEA